MEQKLYFIFLTNERHLAVKERKFYGSFPLCFQIFDFNRREKFEKKTMREVI